MCVLRVLITCKQRDCLHKTSQIALEALLLSKLLPEQAARANNTACQSSLRLPSGDMAAHGGVIFPVWQGLCQPEPLAHHLKAAPSPGKEAPAPAAAAAARSQQAMMSPAPGPAPGQATGRKVLHVAAPGSGAAQKPATQMPPAAHQDAVAPGIARAAAQYKAAAAAGATGTMVQTQGTGREAIGACISQTSTDMHLRCPCLFPDAKDGTRMAPSELPVCKVGNIGDVHSSSSPKHAPSMPQATSWHL